MNRRSTSVSLAVCLTLFLSLVPLGAAQTSTETASALPRLVRFGGVVKDLDGNPLTGVVGITFSLYSEQTGGAALWLETQNVTADSNGHYTALLGATKPDGLPPELFTSVEARWVGVQVSGQAEQPRVLLVSAPYAFKAGDAETIGGLPPSAFVLAAPLNGTTQAATADSVTAQSVSSATSTDVTTSGGTVNAIPLFSTATDIENSVITQAVNTAGTTFVDIGTYHAPAILDVDGAVRIGSTMVGGRAFGGITMLGAPILHQCCDTDLLNIFVGGAGNFTLKNGAENSALGNGALISIGPGSNNVGPYQDTAVGYWALISDTSGSQNTALGALAGRSTVSGNANVTGAQNTFLGYASGPGSTTQLTNATAVGSNAVVSENNALVLGSISGVNGATSNTNVGIGTTSPQFSLDINGNLGNSAGTLTFGSPVAFVTGQTFPGTGTITGIATNPGLTGGGTLGNVTIGIDPTVVAELGLENQFTASQNVVGSLSATYLFSSSGVTAGGGAVLPATGNSQTVGSPSNPLDLIASASNGSTATSQTFRWQNINADGATPSANLNLLFGSGSGIPQPTGLYVMPTGIVHFATGQTFPGGSGGGTVTSVAVTPGGGLLSSANPITTTGTLNIDPTVVPQLGASTNNFAGNITAASFTGSGTGLTNVNAAMLNGVSSFNIPTLTSGNTFQGNQVVQGNFAITGVGNTLTVGGPSTFNMDVSPGAAATANCLASAGAGCVGFQFNGLTGNTILNAQINGTTELNVDSSGDMMLSGGLTAAGATLPALGTATGTSGFASSPLNLIGSAYNGSAAQPVEFAFQTVPQNNGASNASGSLNLTYALGANAPQNVLSIANNGVITFAPGQTFPNTVSNVTAGSGLSGGGTGNVTLSLPTCSSGQVLQSTGTGWVCAVVSGGGGGITGGGTVNSLALFSGATSVGSSNVFQSTTNTNIGIGTATPQATLDVNGSINLPNTTSATVGVLSVGGVPFLHNYGTQNTYVGQSAGNMLSLDSGRNTAVGANALSALAATGRNTAVGANALSANTFGGLNTAVGNNALNANIQGDNNAAFGDSALAANTSDSNSAFGQAALAANTSGLANTAVGQGALGNNTTGNDNTASGYGALGNNSGSSNIALGYQAGMNLNSTESDDIYIGNLGTAGESGIIRIGTPGTQTAAYVAGTLNVGNLTVTGTCTGCGGSGSGGGGGTVTSVGTGLGLMGGPITGSGTISINTGVVPQLTASNTFTGAQTISNGSLSVTGTPGNITASGTISTSGTVSAGTVSAPTITANSFSVAGTTVLSHGTSTGGALVLGEFSGNSTLLSASNTSSATVLGDNAMRFYTGGSFNTAVGNSALYQATSGANNTGVGYAALTWNSTGSANTAIGYNAGTPGVLSDTTGSNNTFVGASSGSGGQTSLSYATAIGSGALVEAPNSMALGGLKGSASAVSVGIGTATPQATLDVEAVTGFAGYFYNNDPSGFNSLYAISANAATGPFVAYNTATGGYCSIDASGDLSCSGTKNAVVPIDGGARKVALSAIESPKNWFEDAGSAQLMHGSAVVNLDPDFIQTVNTGMDYKVFPVPNGDCKGLYITNKTATSFEVRELGGGTSNVAFDYRIMALRKNYENVRFADHTNDPALKRMEERKAATMASPSDARPAAESPRTLAPELAPKPRTAHSARLSSLNAQPK